MVQENAIIEKLKKEGLPVTRENYLQFAYLGNPPEHLTAEEEDALPTQFQFKGDDDDDE